MLYVTPEPISMRKLTEAVGRNWKNLEIENVSANLAGMRSLIVRQGKKGQYTYKLSGAGRSWIRDELVPKLRLET